MEEEIVEEKTNWMSSAVAVTVWEALPEENRRNEDGHLIIKRPVQGVLKPFRHGSIYSCCGRAFLTIKSLENHSREECLQLESHVKERPSNYDQLARPGCFTNLLVLQSRLKYLQHLKASFPVPKIILERVVIAPPSIRKQSPVASSPELEMPLLSPVSTITPVKVEVNGDVLTPVSENSIEIKPPVIELITSLFPLPNTNRHGPSPKPDLRKPHRCNICSFSSNFDINLKNHYTRDHPSIRKRTLQFEGHVKKKAMTSSVIAKKYTNMSSGVFSSIGQNQCCSLCGTSTNNLRSHMKYAHVRSTSNKCKYCCCSFSSKKGLKLHIYSQHRIKREDKKSSVNRESTNYKKSKTSFKCSRCPIRFADIGRYNNHVKMAHVSGSNLRCVHCPCSFKHVSSLRSHVAYRHNRKSSNYSGYNSSSNQSQSDDELESSAAGSTPSSTSTGVNCNLCGKYLKAKFFLSIHKQVAHVPNGISCSHCPCSFVNLKALNVHLSKEHPSELNGKIPNDGFVRVKKTRLSDKMESFDRSKSANVLECPKGCRCPILDRETLELHIKLEHPNSDNNDENDHDNFEENKKDLRLHTDSEVRNYFEGVDDSDKVKSNLFVCKLCNRKINKQDLSTHLQTAHGNGKYKCKFCPCRYTNASSVSTHVSKFHKNEELSMKTQSAEDLACRVKKRKVEETETAKVEMKKNATNNKCEDLSSSEDDEIVEIPSKSPPRSPLKTENKEGSPLSLTCRCKKCGTVFQSVVNLLEHLKSFHGLNSLFKCSLCYATFVNPESLTKHLMTHAPPESNRTPKKLEFKQKKNERKKNKNLENTVSKNILASFPCKKCSSSFESQLQLGLHIQVQHGTVDIDCQYCNSSFSCKENLAIHERIYHLEENSTLPAETTVHLKENGNESEGASANGSHFENACAKANSESELQNNQIPACSRIYITPLATNNCDENMEMDVHLGYVFRKGINLDEEFPTIFEYIMNETENKLPEAASSMSTNRNGNLQKTTFPWTAPPELINITDTDENSDHSCEVIEIIHRATEKRRRTKPKHRNHTKISENGFKSSENNTTTSGGISNLDIDALLEESTEAIEKYGNLGGIIDLCDEGKKDNILEEPEVDELPEIHVDHSYFGDNELIVENDNDNSLDTDRQLTNCTPSSQMLDEMLRRVNYELCKTDETESWLRNSASTYCSQQNHFYSLNLKREVSHDNDSKSLASEKCEKTLSIMSDESTLTADSGADDIDERLNISQLSTEYEDDFDYDTLLKNPTTFANIPENNFNLLNKEISTKFKESEVCGDLIEEGEEKELQEKATECKYVCRKYEDDRSLSEISTEYEDDSQDEESYSNVCYHCGSTVINLSFHEKNCSSQDILTA